MSPVSPFSHGILFHIQANTKTNKSICNLIQIQTPLPPEQLFFNLQLFTTASSTLTSTQPNHTTTTTTAIMSSSRSPYKVQVHQQEPSIHSSYSYSSDPYTSSGSSTPRSYTSGNYREYGASESHHVKASTQPALTQTSDKHTSNIASSGKNLVINHNKVGYTDAAPNPKYSGGYSRTSY